MKRLAHLAILIATAPIVAQSQVWRTWDASDGLADSYAGDIQLDSDGSIWVSHGRGLPLSVLDGYEVRLKPVPEDADEVFAVGFGELWTISKRGVHLFADGEWRLLEVPDLGDLPADARIESGLVPLAPGQVAAVLQDRVLRIDFTASTTKTLVRAEDAPLSEFKSVSRAPGGALLAGCADGILEIPVDSPREDEEGYSRVIRLDPRQGQNVIGISVGPAGEIVVVAESPGQDQRIGLRWFAGEWTRLWATRSSNLRMWHGPDGLVYALDGAQALRFGANGPEIIPGSERIGRPGDALHDDNGSLWIATPQGISAYAPSIWTSARLGSPPEDPVHAALEDDQRGLWFAAGHKLLNLQGETWRTIDLPPGKAAYTLHVNAIAQLSGGQLALKTRDPAELLLFDAKNSRFESVRHPSGRMIRMIASRSDGRIWVNTSDPNDRFDQDLSVYDGKEFKTVLDRGRDWGVGRMRTIYVDGDETVWIGGTEGIARWSGDQYELWGEQGDLEAEGAYAFLRTRDGRLLAGGRTMVRELHDDSWTEVVRLGKVRDLAEDAQGRLWVVGEKGVHSRVDGVWISQDARDGLPATASYCAFVDSRSRLWVGSDNGLALHSPQNDKDPPRVRMVGAQERPIFESSSAVSIRFLGADKWKKTIAERLLYQYCLDGAEWSALGDETSFELRQANAGAHTLRVRAVDRNGNRTEAGQEFSFVVQAPWHLRTAFLALATAALLVILGLLGWAAHSYRGKTRLVRELRTATEAAEAARAATEEVVRSQTNDLRITNAELIISREKAEEASRLKSEFVANISHEIRSPLTVIMGMTELVRQNDRLDAGDRENLDTVLRSTEDLRRILDDVLDFSRIEGRRLSLEQTAFDVILLANDAVSGLRPAARRKGLDLSAEAKVGAPRFVIGDATRVRQILTNLLENAIKFTLRGSVRLTLEADRSQPGAVELSFRVEDTGIGIPEEHLERMFEPFAQLDASTTRRFGGSGLGLAICSRLARLMSGDIVVESRPGVGSVFSFRACFVLPPESLTAAEPADREWADDKTVLMGTRALIVDDISAVRQVLRQVLTRWGVEILEAAGADEAIAVYREKRPELVLMDIQMPGKSGVETARAIREMDATLGCSTRILAVTAHAAAGDRERYLGAGMDGYVSKPIDRAKLLEAILHALGRQPRSAPDIPRRT